VTAYYNEVEPFAAQWLRNLIAAGHITPGEVDERSIEDVRPDDLRGFTQCHFFAGIGVWSYALRLAGWPDGRPVWTGSCPCQPFSVAGKQAGTTDKRHLWPAWFRLIRECRPQQIFGEQVASPAALAWLDAVQTDLEDADYAVGAADLCAASVGAPHVRQRLYWVGYSDSPKQQRTRPTQPARRECDPVTPRTSEVRGMGDPGESRGRRHAGAVPGSQEEGSRERSTTRGVSDEFVSAGTNDVLADTQRDGSGTRRTSGKDGETSLEPDRLGTTNCWSTCDWLPCSDGKMRPTQPGLFPLAHGIAGRVGRLRAYGNALCAPVATAFIKAAMETTEWS